MTVTFIWPNGLRNAMPTISENQRSRPLRQIVPGHCRASNPRGDAAKFGVQWWRIHPITNGKIHGKIRLSSFIDWVIYMIFYQRCPPIYEKPLAFAARRSLWITFAHRKHRSPLSIWYNTSEVASHKIMDYNPLMDNSRQMVNNMG